MWGEDCERTEGKKRNAKKEGSRGGQHERENRNVSKDEEDEERKGGGREGAKRMREEMRRDGEKRKE